MVQGTYTGYSGNFQKPSVIPGVTNYQFNTAYYTVPVPLMMGEALVQSSEVVVPILDVRMNDVFSTTVQQLSTGLFANNSANALMPSSFVDGFDNGTNVATYGGINRLAAGNSYWQGQYYASAGAVLTRSALASYLVQVTAKAGGDSPDFVVMSPSDYATLQSDFIGTETIYVVPGKEYSADTDARHGFRCLNIDGVPFFMDYFCPKGTLYMVNSKYMTAYLDENAAFSFSGFKSGIPVLSISQVGVMLLGHQFICSKPSSCAVVTGITGGAF